MYGKYLVEQNKDRNVVTTIYNLAKAMNQEALEDFLLQGHCVGFFYQGRNAVMLLAEEGNRSSTFFLIEKFHASLHHAVEGAAQGGKFELVEYLLAHGASIHAAVKGAAAVATEKNTQVTQRLIDLGASLAWAALGAGFGANQNFFNQYQGRVVFLQGIQGAMKAGHYDFAATLKAAYLASLKSLNQGYLDDLDLCYACGAAVSGDIKVVETILTTHAVAADVHFPNYLRKRLSEHAAFADQDAILQLLIREKSYYVDYAVLGAATAGNYPLTMALLNRGASSFSAAEGAGTAGHLDLLKVLMARENKESQTELWQKALTGAGKEGQLAVINAQNIASGQWNAATLSIIEPLGQTPESQFLFLSCIKQTDFRNHIIQEFKLPHNFIKRTEAISNLRNSYGITIKQAQLYLTMEKIQREYFIVLPQIFKGKLPIELCFHILSFALGLSNVDSDTLFRVANLQIEQRLKKHPIGFFASLKSLFKTSENLALAAKINKWQDHMNFGR